MSNKVFYGADKKKKSVDKEDDSVVELTEYKSSTKVIQAFTYVMNDERKLYDLLIISIDMTTLESTVEVEKLRVDSEARAIMEVQKRNSDNLIKRIKGRK